MSKDVSGVRFAACVYPSDFAQQRKPPSPCTQGALIARPRSPCSHVVAWREQNWTEFHGVRQTLSGGDCFRRIAPSLPCQSWASMSGDHHKDKDPEGSAGVFLEQQQRPDCLATHQDKGRGLWKEKSVAQPVARKSHQMTLFIPAGVKGFVSLQDGAVSLKNILIPVAPVPTAQPSIQAAVRLATRLNCPAGRFTILYVGDDSEMPEVSCPELPGWEWTKLSQKGDITEVILQTAHATEADLIIMATEGHNGFLDALRGSHSEQVLRQCACPLLVIPAGGWVSSVL